VALRTTSTLRNLWGPPCRFHKATVGLYGTGQVTVDYRIIQAVYALNRCLIRHNYRTIYAQTGAFVCRAITGGTGYSLHAYGIAMDINWLRNGYGDHAPHEITDALANDIKAIRTNNGAQVWGWGGDYTAAPKDRMHFEIVASPAELANGIRTTTPVDQGDEFVMDAEAKAAFTAVEKQNAEQLAWMLRMEARIEELETDRWKPTTIRARELVEHFGITSEA
jgi:hypothetical protein